MRLLGTSMALTALVAALGGCPAIVGLDGDYSAGGGGGPGTDGGGSGDGVAPEDGGHHTGGKHDSGGSGSDTGGGGAGGHANDSGHPGDTGTPPSDTGGPCPTTCPLVAPSGWTLVAYEASRSDSCPSGFTKTDVVEPTDGGSCNCGDCTITSAPNCYPPYPASISSMWNVTGTTCDGTGGYFLTNGGACVTDAIGNAGYVSMTGPAPIAGACTSSASGIGPSSTEERICTPTACASDACESSLGSSFTTCLYQAGDQACPAAATNKHTAGSSAGVTCTDCNCGVTDTGCSGSVAIYDSMSSCSGSPVITLDTDGTCYAMPGGTEGDSYIYTASATGVSCNAGSSTATVDITGQGTICCP
jgi:hypothetical protein